jgi:glycosyltransferase involved in cell wall biosynthesis
VKLADVTPVLLTFNEAPNLGRTLMALAWAPRIVVLDSGSTDRTLEILRADPRVRILHRPFDTHAAQWNFALREAGLSTPWVLALDADYRVSEELVDEIRKLEVPPDVSGYRVRFQYMIDGRPLRGSLYPPSVVLFRRDQAEYFQDGHTQRLRVHGGIRELCGRIWHDDRKPFAHWRSAQRRYMALEARKLRETPFSNLSWTDRTRRLLLGPLLVVPYCLLMKGLIFDGVAGLKYTFQRFYAEALLAFALLSPSANPKTN